VARGVKRPKAYANASTMPAVIAACRAAGIKDDEYDRWVAHYDGIPQFTDGLGEKAKQYTDHGYGRSLDLSVVDPSFFGARVPAVNKVDYSRFDKTPRRVFLQKRTEQGQVELYDKLRALQTPKLHPRRLQLAFTRKVLQFFAERVATVAIKDEPLKNGKPSWSVDYRGWRYQQLIHRAQGARLV
jgi:hypothetical protein